MLNAAKKAALEAGKIQLKYFKSNKIKDLKLKDSIVTRADLESEKAILDIIRKKFPTHNIFSEEIGKIDVGSEYTWLIDPLDGTTNFTKGNPLFATSIALIKDNEPIVGVVYNPVLDEMYWAEKGGGAFLNREPIKVSSRKEVKGSYIVMCEGNHKDLKRSTKLWQVLGPKVKDIRKLGSAALECVYVAAGKADIFITTQINPYDVGAGILLIREAGGKATDFQGNPWPLDKVEDFIGTNGKLQDQVVRLISKY
ncbi:MAG: inositol monophosphatase family protein [Patescibacteria group bacterium]